MARESINKKTRKEGQKEIRAFQIPNFINSNEREERKKKPKGRAGPSDASSAKPIEHLRKGHVRVSADLLRMDWREERMSGPTDRWMNGPTDRRTAAVYGDARPHLKSVVKEKRRKETSVSHMYPSVY